MSTENFANPGSESFETFDSFEEVSPEDNSSDDDWSKEDPSEKEDEEVKEDLKVLKDTKVDLDGKVIKEDKEKGKKEDKPAPKKEKEEAEDEEDEDEEDSEEVEEKDEAKEDAPEKKDTKKLRLRMGDELYNIDPNATIKHKVDGEMVDVSIQEALNNYSGKQAWDKKFTELGQEKKTFEFERNQFEEKRNELKSYMEEIVAPFKDPTKNVKDSYIKMFALAGIDPYIGYRRLMEDNLEELSSLLDMTETERELHFHKVKDGLYADVNKQRQEQATKQQNLNRITAKIDALRQAKNVSEDQFVDASEELRELYKEQGLDAKSITEEVIVDYASLKPHIAKVKELVQPYEDNIADGKYGEVVKELSTYLRDGKADEATIQSILKRNFSVEEEVKDLNTRLYQKSNKKGKGKVEEYESKETDSFDDWT